MQEKPGRSSTTVQASSTLMRSVAPLKLSAWQLLKDFPKMVAVLVHTFSVQLMAVIHGQRFTLMELIREDQE
jgi:hypothetical protein